MNTIVQQLRDLIPQLKFLSESEIFVMQAHTRTIFYDNRMSLEEKYDKIVVKLPKLVFVNCRGVESVYALDGKNTICYPPFPNILNNLRICVTVGSNTAKKTARNFFNSGFTNSGCACLNIYGDYYADYPMRLFDALNSGILKLIPVTAKVNRRSLDFTLS